MPKQQTDYLIDLIKRLTKAEKRSFRLFANRQNSKDDKLFMVLFDFIEGNESYDEDTLLQKYSQIRKVQLSNIKANLYKQLLTNLRLLYRNSINDINTRELIDFAKVLHAKGMYKASLDVLYKAKQVAYANEETSLAYVAVEFERVIENQYITGSMSEKAEEIELESRDIITSLSRNNEFANLSLRLYGLYLKYGYVKDSKESMLISEFFNSHMPTFQLKNLNFYDKAYLYQSYIWYYNMLQDFANNYKYCQKWVDMFDSEREMIENNMTLYIKSLHNILSATFMANRADKFSFNFQKLEKIEEEYGPKFLINDQSVYLLVKNVHLLNQIFLTGQYRKGVDRLKDLEILVEDNTLEWDVNRIIVFNYKLACVHFGADNHGRCIDFLNAIINAPVVNVRNDIQCFARILNLIAHYELGNDVLIRYQIKSVYRFLSKMEELHSVQREIFAFLRKLPNIKPLQMKVAFKKLRANLMKMKDDPYERRAFLYLDIISWLDSKIEEKTIEEVIQSKIGMSKIGQKNANAT